MESDKFVVEKYKKLMGYDNRGEVFDADHFVFRKINDDYLDSALDIYFSYKNNNFEKLGIVNTQLAKEYGQNFLKHEKHIISYPYEWPVDMFKKAALFQLDLFIELDKYGFTLKDAIPANIVFNNTKPVFVDFLSILKKDSLIKEEWLFEGNNKVDGDLRFLVFEKMFFPFYFIPLFLMKRNKIKEFRDMLFNRACNALGSSAPDFKDLLGGNDVREKITNILDIFTYQFNAYKHRKQGFVSFCKFLKDYVQNLDMGYSNSDYTSYYVSKKEDFDFLDSSDWKAKQKSVYSVIKFDQPDTVLDLGANTGWFSELACRNGASVIATDIDEASVNFLYKYAKSKKLNILPLVLSFQDLLKSKQGIALEELGPSVGNQEKLFMEPVKRIKSDLVLSLALVHHLVLGQGLSIENVFKILSQVTKKALVLEYVGWDDELIKKESTFFKNLNKFTKETYNLNLFIKEGKKQFKSVELLESHPATRTLLVFRR
ncbi:MAG: class I SAM-dependent methyltransferase [bacterium]